MPSINDFNTSIFKSELPPANIPKLRRGEPAPQKYESEIEILGLGGESDILVLGLENESYAPVATYPLSVAIDAGLYERFKAICDREGRSLAETVEEVLALWME